MEFGNFQEFIYFSSLTISVNFPDQLVTIICTPVFERLCSILEWIDVNYCFLLNLKECHSSKY